MSFFFAITIPLFSSENFNYSLVINLLIYWLYSTLKCGSWELKFSARQGEDFLNVLIFFRKETSRYFLTLHNVTFTCQAFALYAENILPFLKSGFAVCDVCLKDVSPTHPSCWFFSSMPGRCINA